MILCVMKMVDASLFFVMLRVVGLEKFSVVQEHPKTIYFYSSVDSTDFRNTVRRGSSSGRGSDVCVMA